MSESKFDVALRWDAVTVTLAIVAALEPEGVTAFLEEAKEAGYLTEALPLLRVLRTDLQDEARHYLRQSFRVSEL